MAPVRTTLDTDEKALNIKLDDMYMLVRDALDRSLQSLYDHNPSNATQVINEDSRINELQHKIEERGIRTIALQQPVARDLRTLMSDIYISMELERIADHAADIASIVLKLKAKPSEEYLEPISKIADKCRAMLMAAMQAYNELDDKLAIEIAAMDNEIDIAEQEFNDFLLKKLCIYPDDNNECTYLLWVTHHLERIGDRITNITERIIYVKNSATTNLNQ